MIYKTEMHCHTKMMSGCASITEEQSVEQHIALGYDTIVLTNHLEKDRIDAPIEYRYRYDSYEEYVNKIFDAIEYMRAYAGDRITVLDGVELRTYQNDSDYLVYGISREIMLSKPDLLHLDCEALHDYLSSCGCLIIQAHPMRTEMTLTQPEFVDGYEVYNNSRNWKKYNEVAELWSRMTGGEDKIYIAGNDHHHLKDTPRAGIVTHEQIRTSADLVRILKAREFEIVRP